MKYLLLTTALIAWLAPATMKLNDLDRMTGKKWAGTLTYLDYGTNKWEPVATDLTVTAGKAPGVYNWITVYPQERGHNSSDELVISPDGKTFDGETVQVREEHGDTLRFSTSKAGNDNHKVADFRFSYVITRNTFSRVKEVCYQGEKTWFTRNKLILKTTN